MTEVNQDSSSKLPEKENPSELPDELIEKLVEKMQPTMNESIKATMMEVMQQQQQESRKSRKRSRSKSPASSTTNSYSNEEALSLFAKEGFHLDDKQSPGKKQKRNSSSKTSSRDSSIVSPPRSEGSSTGSNRTEKAGFNRDKNAQTGFNRDDDAGSNRGEKENCDPDKTDGQLDICEELLRLCEDDVRITDDYGPKIRQAIAERVIKYFTKGALQSDARAVIFKKHKLAENISEIDTPKMNTGVLKKESMNHKYISSREKTLYNIQNNVSRSAMAMTTIITHAMAKEEKSEMMNPKDITTTCLEALTLLGYVSKQLSNQRKDNIKSGINDELRSLCDHERPTTKYLLGDDLSKGAKEARELSKLSKKTQQKRGNSSGNTSRNSSSNSSGNWGGNNRKSGYSSQQSSSSYPSQKSFLSKGPKKGNKR